MGQGSKEKEAKQEYRFKGSCTEGDFGPIPCGASGGTSELSQSGAKRAGVLIPLHRQSLEDINFQALPVLGGYMQSGSDSLGQSANRERV